MVLVLIDSSDRRQAIASVVTRGCRMIESPLSAFAATLTFAPSDDAPKGDACCERFPVAVEEPDRRGSRRRRLWELDACAHCPVIGVCLPKNALRRLFEKVGVLDVSTDDYALHCDAMGACKRRSPVAEALQREFDRRFASALRQSDRVKTTDALAAWWQEASAGSDLPGAVWATITHARCDGDLQHRLLGEVHMLQHQVGSAERVERGRLEAALDERADGRRVVAALHDRLQRQATDHVRQVARQQAELTRVRGELVKRDMEIAALRGELEHVRPAVAGLPGPTAAALEGHEQRERISELRRALMHARAELVRARRPRLDDASTRRVDERTEPPARTPTTTDRVLDERAVLCVGGRPASVPLYRRIVEETGGRFIHHDGGDQQNVHRLDVILAAADLVICQTGCISHDAYWRVKDHCKRTGKQCVFVENPGSASLKRALAVLHAAEPP